MNVRIDKWLWCVRIYKTRTVAADAVKMNRVTVNGAWVKPSYDVKVGDEVLVPSGKMGDVMSDLQNRRAMIQGMASDKGFDRRLWPSSIAIRPHFPL
jgi:ribosomal 50S subunit-recycling heat shock protein